ncbi:MAG: hypothetical protein BWZ10_01134 [candidate division BRC1 bacterium ADurb.BinA364]|nr:MAG: hypothetical protein BWZ10_01134 [candidate division BRC1 bacterium ADurb.BinA364]
MEFAPSTTQAHVLLTMLFTGETPQQSKTRPAMPKAERDKLIAEGLIEAISESTAVERGSISAPIKQSKAKYLALTDKGWLWMAENLDALATPRLKLNPAPLRGLLSLLKAHLKSRGVSLAEFASPPKACAPASLSWQIRAAYLKAAGGQWDSRVRLADLRRALPETPRASLDKELLALQQRGALVLCKMDDPMEMRDDDRDAELDIEGAKRHVIYMKGE